MLFSYFLKVSSLRSRISLVLSLMVSYEAIGLDLKMLRATQNSPVVREALLRHGYAPELLIPFADKLVSSTQGNQMGQSRYQLLFLIRSDAMASSDVVVRVDLLNSWESGQPETFEVLSLDVARSQAITDGVDEFLAPPRNFEATQISAEKALEELEDNLRISIEAWKLMRKVVEIDLYLLNDLLASFAANQIQTVYDFLVDVESRIPDDVDRGSENIVSIALTEASSMLSERIVNTEIAVIKRLLSNERAALIFDHYFKNRAHLNEAIETLGQLKRSVEVSQQSLSEIRQELTEISSVPPWVQEAHSYVDQLDRKASELIAMIDKVEVARDWDNEIFQDINSDMIRASLSLSRNTEFVNSFFHVNTSSMEDLMASRAASGKGFLANDNRCTRVLSEVRDDE